jgi:putative membrane protein
LLALTCEIFIIILLVSAHVLGLIFGLTQQLTFDAFLIALATIFGFRLLILLAVSQQSLVRAIIPASVQTVVTAFMLFVYSGTLYYLEVGGPLLETYLARPETAAPEVRNSIFPFDFVLLAILCVIHALAVLAFIRSIDQPWRRGMGVSLLSFIGGFIGHLTEDTAKLEQFFEKLGEDALVPIDVISFQSQDGTEKAQFVLPMVHPGPMGEIGGGALPERLAEQTEGLAFAPHATASHDFNPVTERQTDIICDAVNDVQQQITYSETATHGIREREGSATLTGVAFGETGFIVNTYAPHSADDIEYSVGLSARSEASTAGLEDVLVADAHNCNNGYDRADIGLVEPGSQASFDLITGAGRLGTKLAETDQHPLSLGIAEDETPWGLEEGFGSLGIRVAVFESDGHRTAYILIDGNNLQGGLRERIIESVEGVDLVEVMTTDTHVVNTVESENKVGEAIPINECIDLISDLTAEAIDDLEPVKVGGGSSMTKVTVFGNDRTETLASHANALVSMGTALALTFTLAVLLVSVLVFIIAAQIL